MNPGRTRKIGFATTAMLLFAVLVWQAYQAGVGTVLLSLALHDAPLCVRDPLIALAAALFAGCFAHAYHLGRDDSEAVWRASGAPWGSPSLRSRHAVSWCSLLAPAAVTAVIVSLATRRRAAPGVASEDEDGDG